MMLTHSALMGARLHEEEHFSPYDLGQRLQVCDLDIDEFINRCPNEVVGKHIPIRVWKLTEDELELLRYADSVRDGLWNY